MGRARRQALDDDRAARGRHLAHEPLTQRELQRRPVDGELVLAPPLAGAPPDQRLPTDLVTADPVKRLLLHVRMILVLDEEMRRVFAVAGRLAD